MFYKKCIFKKYSLHLSQKVSCFMQCETGLMYSVVFYHSTQALLFCIIVADRSSPALAPACPTAAPGRSQSLASCQRRRPQHQFPNLRAHLGKCRFPCRRRSQRLKRGRRQRTIPTRTGVLSVRTEESCSVVTSVPKFFI